MAFICICNPIEVWDCEGFFSSSPENGYWVFPKATFLRVKTDDRLFLRLTSKAKTPGVCGIFSVTNKRVGSCPEEFWREGRRPAGLQYLVDFRIDAYFPERSISPQEIRDLGVSDNSKFLKVPQQMAAEVPMEDAAMVEREAKRRLGR